MPFSKQEIKSLKAASKVGPKSIERLEMIGIDGFEILKNSDAEDICFRLSIELEQPRLKTCPLIRAAMQNAIDAAKAN